MGSQCLSCGASTIARCPYCLKSVCAGGYGYHGRMCGAVHEKVCASAGRGRLGDQFNGTSPFPKPQYPRKLRRRKKAVKRKKRRSRR